MSEPIFQGGPLGEGAPVPAEGLTQPDPGALPASMVGREVQDESADEAPPTEARMDSKELVSYVMEMLDESKMARKTGPNARFEQWERNVHAYWSRQEEADEQKAEWQASERLPDVANFVERFVAALRSALTAAGDDWYGFKDPLKTNSDLAPTAKRVIDALLERCGTNSSGHPIGFAPVFASGMRLGALMKPAFSVTWANGKLQIDVVDPRELYYDPNGQGLYRIRERPMAVHKLMALGEIQDANGDPLYDIEAIKRAASTAELTEDKQNKEELTGEGRSTAASRRREINVQEFIGTILDRDGHLVAHNQLIVVANGTEVIRGPEKNPFWHGKDWIVSSPLIDVPLSVDGRSYVESFEQIANTFREMTNLLLDAVRQESTPGFMFFPDVMEDPNEIKDGVYPGKTFQAAEDAVPGDQFIRKIEMGETSQALFAAWEATRGLLREYASQNELRLGSLASKSEVTATEINTAEAGSDGLQNHIAEDIEEQLLAPILELAWATGLQHLSEDSDQEIREELGPEAMQLITTRRDEFRTRSFRLRAHGVSGMLRLGQERNRLLGLLQTLAQSDLLTSAFGQTYSIDRALRELMRTFRVDHERLKLTDEEIQQRQQAEAAAAEEEQARELEGEEARTEGQERVERVRQDGAERIENLRGRQGTDG